MVDRKISVMHKLYGIDWENTCKGCSHLIGGKYHDRQYYKCEVYGMTHSEATDWRRSWQACCLRNAPIDMEHFVPVIEYKKRAPKSPEPPLEGQMRMEV